MKKYIPLIIAGLVTLLSLYVVFRVGVQLPATESEGKEPRKEAQKVLQDPWCIENPNQCKG